MEDENDITHPHEIFTGGAQLLDSVRLTGVALYLWLPPLNSVTTLQLISQGPDRGTTGAEFCASAHSLMHLELEGDVIVYWNNSPMIDLPCLRTLSIATPSLGFPELYCDPLHTINAPLLEALSTRYLDGEASRMLPPEPSFPNLRSLILSGINPADPPVTLSIIEAFPMVNYVAYDGSYHDILPLLQEVDRDSRGMYWPHLRILALKSQEFEDKDLQTCISSRDQMGSPIKVLYLPANLTEEDSTELPSAQDYLAIAQIDQ